MINNSTNTKRHQRLHSHTHTNAGTRMDVQQRTDIGTKTIKHKDLQKWASPSERESHDTAPTRLQFPSTALGCSGWRDSDGDLARGPLHGDGESARTWIPSHLAQLAAGGESLHHPLLLPSSPIHTFVSFASKTGFS